MSENEFDVHRGNEKDARDNVVLTGEEIELPGDGSDAAAIIGEASEPINTGEIESVAIGGLTGRVPGAAPLKPTIEDKISTGELPVVSAPSVPSDEADVASASEVEPVDASFEAPQVDAAAEPVAEETAVEEPSQVDAPSVEESAVEESTVEAGERRRGALAGGRSHRQGSRHRGALAGGRSHRQGSRHRGTCRRGTRRQGRVLLVRARALFHHDARPGSCGPRSEPGLGARGSR